MKNNNTNDLIKKIIVDGDKSSEALDEFKNQREPAIKKYEEESDTKNEDIPSSKSHKGETLTHVSNTESKVLSDFNKMLDSEFYRDKKEPFLMSLSGDCLEDYENIAFGMSFKTKKRINRNDIIRKVLEHYMHKRKSQLQTIIAKL